MFDMNNPYNRKMAGFGMMGDAIQQPAGRMAGNVYVPQSGTQALARALQMYGGQKLAFSPQSQAGQVNLMAGPAQNAWTGANNSWWGRIAGGE